MKKKILIFYQSIAEITEILSVIKKHSFGECVIVITGGKYLLTILNKLKLKQKFGLIFYEFHELSLKNPFNVLRMYLRFNYSYDSKKILTYCFEEAIFFNQYMDFVTPVFLSKCNIKKITYIDFYNSKFSKKKIKIGIKDQIKKIIIKILHKNAKVKTTFLTLYATHKLAVMYFYLPGRTIIKKQSTIRQSFSSFSLPLKKSIKKKKKIIYLDSNDEVYAGKKFKQIVLNLLKLSESIGYHIIISKHPRVKLSSSLTGENKWSYISSSIPIQLYNLKKIDFVFGYFSSGLPILAQKYPQTKVISIVKLLYPYNFIKFIDLNKYHSKLQTVNKIFYPSKFDQIEKILKNKNDSDIY